MIGKKEPQLQVRGPQNKLICPVCERSAAAFDPFGLTPRYNARCPNCFSLERHRLVWLFFCRQTDLFTSQHKRFLHIAPEPCLSRRLRAVPSILYLSADLIPRKAMSQMDVTRINFPDSYFHVIYCSHVLEHVPDDRQAMCELRRVLAPTGWAVFMVPITAAATWEDPRIIDPDARERAFGQRDHVRRYGPDFEIRLAEAGFKVNRIRPLGIVTVEEMRLMAINRSDDIFLSTKELNANKPS
jgi:SAM-dependent methyltransferase